MSKPIQPQPHGVLDYVVGLVLIVSPWVLQFRDTSAVATQTFVAIGIFSLVLSLLTNYPLGLIKAIPFKMHGVIETLGALFLLISPWLLGFADDTSTARTLAVIVGVAWLGVVAMTNYSYEEQRLTH